MARLMVTVFMAFLAAGEASHGNFVSTLLCDMVGFAAFSALANSVPCRFNSIVAAPCPPCRARNRPVSEPVTASITRFFGGGL